MAPESASRSYPLSGPSALSTPTSACNLGANPFPEVTDLFCRLPLPTLFCRAEAFSLGDRLRLTVRTRARERDLPWIFQAHAQDTLLHESRMVNPVPARSFSRVDQSFKKRRRRHPGPAHTVSRIVTALPLHFPAARLRNDHAFPCRNSRRSHYQR